MECRLCLRVPALLPLGELAAELVYCCGLQVDADDGLPDHICSSCGHLLDQSTMFKRQCERTDRILRKRLKNNKFKHDNDTDTKPHKTNIDNSNSNRDLNYVETEIKEEPRPFEQDMEFEENIYTCNIKSEVTDNNVDLDSSVKIENTSHNYNDVSMDNIPSISASGHPNLLEEISPVSKSTTTNENTMEFSKNQRGNSVLSYLGFDYHKFRMNKAGVVTWRCKENKNFNCKAIIRTCRDSIYGPPPSIHSHDSQPQKSQANIAVSKMKECIINAGATVKNAIGQIMNELDNDTLAHIPKKSVLSRNLSRHRKGTIQHLPNPITSNFPIPEKYGDIILHDSGECDPDRILAIGNLELVQALDDTDTIYGDGTFDHVPGVFFQLYTWYAKIGNSYPPCIYFLLQRKDLQTYNKMFEVLKILLPNLSPQKVLIDYEQACISAVGIAFPVADVKGCYFHLCHSVIGKINSVGLKTEFESDVNTKLILKSLAALAFVPSNDVRIIFEVLKTAFPDGENYNQVIDYFFSTYIEGVARSIPEFPIPLWNQYQDAIEKSPKATNCCEVFHNSLNSINQCSHPSIWSLFDGLKRDLACHRQLVEKSRTGQPEAKRTKYEQLHELLSEVVQGYHDEPDKLRYLRRLANIQ